MANSWFGSSPILDAALDLVCMFIIMLYMYA